MRMTNPDVGGTQDVGTQDVHGGELLSVLDEMCSWSLHLTHSMSLLGTATMTTTMTKKKIARIDIGEGGTRK